MTRTIDEKLEQLEKRIDKLEFHKSLLQQLVRNYDENSLFDVIISQDLSREQFEELLDITKKYDFLLESGEKIQKYEFLMALKVVLDKHGITVNYEQFSKNWLKGTNGGFGVSKKLAEYLGY